MNAPAEQKPVEHTILNFRTSELPKLKVLWNDVGSHPKFKNQKFCISGHDDVFLFTLKISRVCR